MKKSFILLVIVVLFPLFISSCDSEEEEQPMLLLGNVGFEGTLPDGRTFGTTDIRSANGTGSSGVNSKYSGRHQLSIRTFDHKWTLSIETPSKNFPDTPPFGESVPREVIHDYFNTHYPYEDVLNAFLSEKSKAKADVNYTSFEQIRVQLSNMEKYFAYMPDAFFPLKGGKVRVLEVNEGIKKNEANEDVRSIEVTIEFDLPMKASDPTIEIQEGNLKGVGRFRYREDFDQREFEN